MHVTNKNLILQIVFVTLLAVLVHNTPAPNAANNSGPTFTESETTEDVICGYTKSPKLALNVLTPKKNPTELDWRTPSTGHVCCKCSRDSAAFKNCQQLLLIQRNDGMIPLKQQLIDSLLL